MSVVSELRQLTRVQISGPSGILFNGRIEDICPAAEVDLDTEFGASRVALICCGMDTGFYAIEIGDKWYRLNDGDRACPLTLEIIGQYEWPSPQPS